MKRAEVVYNGPVFKIDGISYSHHKNGGGIVAETAHVEETVFIGPNVWVYDDAQIFDNVRITGRAHIRGHAVICDNVKISGSAWIGDCVFLCGNVEIGGNVSLGGNVIACGNAKIFGENLIRLCGHEILKSKVVIQDGIKYTTRLAADKTPTIRDVFNVLNRGSELSRKAA